MLSRNRQFFRSVFFVFLFLFIASCSGGGCGGCSSCGGTTPLPGGFPTDKAVENAASVRVSKPGLTFLEQNLGPIAANAMGGKNGVVKFEIPETPIDVKDAFCIGFKVGGTCVGTEPDVKGAFCPGGPNQNATPPKCTATLGVGTSQFQIDAVKPDRLNVTVTIPIKLENTPVTITDPISATINVAYGANGTCNGGPTPSVQSKNLAVPVSIPLVAETTAPRTGYTKIDVDGATINTDAIQSNDVRLCGSCGFLPDNWCESLLNWGVIKDRVVNAIKDNLDDMIKSALRDQLCTKPTPTLNPPCPTGSKPDGANAKCVYDTAPDKCVPMLLGTDAHIDLGGFLASISPSASGGLDFGLAAKGAMNPAPGAGFIAGTNRTVNGVTLGMLGGVLPQPPSKCVPQAELKIPTGIPLPDEIAPKQPDTLTSPHVGIALSGRFLDYSMTSVYNSGLLCLGVSTEQFAMLKSGLLSVLVKSLGNLTFDQSDAAAAISTRPQKPPTVKVGGGTNVDTDPLLLITAPEFAIDFYVWSYDRFARVFTFTSDLTIPVNLQSGKDGITPALGGIKALNGKVTNDQIIFERPEVVASGLAGLLGAVSKQLVGSGFSPINLGSALSSLGLGLEVNEIKKLTKDTDDFVGIFATMSKSTAASSEADTTAKLLSKKVDKDHMDLSTYAKEALPELELELSSPQGDGKRVIEYAWSIDKGTKSTWSTATHLVIKDDQLFMQGKHVLHVVARVQGEPATEDTTPADVAFTIDALPPFGKIENEKLVAWDLVSPSDALKVRIDGGDWRTYAEVAKLDVAEAESIEISDEEGNIGVVRQGLRGRLDPSIAGTGSGCGCSTPGKKANDMNAVLALCLALGGLSFVVLRRRRGSRAAAPIAALVTTLAVASTSQGCACGESEDPGTGCGADCNQECQTGMHHGQPGSYLSVAKAKDGAIWAAGWNDVGFEEGIGYVYGDLVVGKYDLGKQSVDWQTVDGIPSRAEGTCPSYERSWRNGETDSGDNVGRWPSIQVSNGGKPMVVYYDDTNNRVKFAHQFEGSPGAWKTFVLREGPKADMGRYAKMVLGEGGKPIVMFMLVEPGNAGKVRSKVVVARAKVEEPKSGEDFDFSDAAVDEDNPCRADTCGAGEKCVKATGTCTKTVAGCTPADCGGGDNACITQDNKATCVALASAVETYPRNMGGYISLAAGPKGLGAVVYDGYRGNLVALSESGGKWTRTILDGETGLRSDNTARDTGDVGMAAALAIAPSGVWHVSYVNGIDETLRYISFADGKPGKSEVVDDGTSVDGKAFSDGKHLVGDDSAIRVDGDVVTILYTDNHSLGVRRAVGTTAGGVRKWDLRSVAVPKTWVKFPQFVPGEDKGLAFWTQVGKSNQSIDGDVIMLP